MAMDRTAWYTTKTIEWNKDIVPLFQPPYSPELSPVENLWHHIREVGQFKNTTFKSMEEVEDKLAENLRNLDNKTVK